MNKTLFALCALSAIWFGPAWGLSVSSVPGTTQGTTGIGAFATTGAMMDGMQVTAYFSPGGSQVLTWADLGGTTGAGGVGGAGFGWSLEQAGDTFTRSWHLSTFDNTSISKLVIDAGAGNTVFDLGTGNQGTAGSRKGVTFSLSANDFWDAAVTYSDEVGLNGASPVGDLYRSLTIDFSGGTLFGPNRSLSFRADTDKLTLAGDIAAVPLPAAAWLFGSGLLALMGMRRSRRRVQVRKTI